MPMMRITTRSSIRVKPFSSPLIRWESFRSIVTPPWSLWSGQTPRQPPRWWQLGRLLRGEPPHGSPGALRPRLATGLPLHRGPDSYWGHLSTPRRAFLSGSFVYQTTKRRRAGGSAASRNRRRTGATSFGRRLLVPPTIRLVHFRRAILLFALVL